MINLLRFNWGIYEWDIQYFGGTVEYTGSVMVKSDRSVIEDAYVSISGIRCLVRMERFRDGNATIIGFVCDGEIAKGNKWIEYDEAHAFVEEFDKCSGKSDDFVELSFVRRIKQYGTGFAQMVCIISFLYCVWTIAFVTFRIECLLLMIVSIIVFILLGMFYKYYRIVDPASYKARIIKDIEEY